MLLSRPDTGDPTLPFLRAAHIPQAPLYMSCGQSHMGPPGSSLREASPRASRAPEGMRGRGCPALSETLGDGPPLPLPRASCPSEEPKDLKWSRALMQVPGLLASPAGLCPGPWGLRISGLGVGRAHTSAPFPPAFLPCTGPQEKQLADPKSQLVSLFHPG